MARRQIQTNLVGRRVIADMRATDEEIKAHFKDMLRVRDENVASGLKYSDPGYQPFPQFIRHENDEYKGWEGEIVSVYMDSDGNTQFDVLVDDGSARMGIYTNQLGKLLNVLPRV